MLPQNTETLWNAETNLLITRLHGIVMLHNVQSWIASLDEARALIPPDTRFRVIQDFYGYEPANLQAHKLMRPVMPLMLAQYGFRTALFDLFDSVDVPFSIDAGRRCVAVAHVHHDAGKMTEYEARLGRETERFFTDPAAAHEWITRLAE